MAFFLFEVAESADLTRVPALIGGPATPARLAPKPATPAHVQYEKPPLSFDGEAVGIAALAGFRARLRVYDYGVISVALQQTFSGSWRELVVRAQALIENAELERNAERICRVVAARLSSVLRNVRDRFLSEDYIVFSVTALSEPRTADALLSEQGDAIAALLRGERQQLSVQEREKVLSQRISYLEDDLVVPTWNAAFVYDTPAGAQAALEIVEFANSQLLEYRHYDELLDRELAEIYKRLERPRRAELFGSRYTKAARHVLTLYVDVNELTDRTENAVKFIGDIYAVRLFHLVGERLGLATWKEHVEAKLKTLDDIYRFTVDQVAVARGNFLELVVVIILVLELVLILLGVMK